MIGDAGKESFRRIITTFRNQHLIPALAPLFLFREALLNSDDFRARNGVDDAAKNHFTNHLVNCDRIRRLITFNPDELDIKSIKALVDKAIDSKESIENGAKPIGGDEIQGQSGGLFTIPWDVSGSDPNIPLPSQLDMASSTGVVLLNGIDAAIVAYTNLESRHRSQFITPNDSMRMYGKFQQIYTYLDMFGGTENMVDVANPRATDLALGAANAPNRKTETNGSVIVDNK